MTDPQDDELPHQIHMALWTDLSIEDIANEFSDWGWSSTKCSWTEYEVELRNKAELVIESKDPVLVHGPIHSASEMTPRICEILGEAGIAHSFEAYDEKGVMILSVREDELNHDDPKE